MRMINETGVELVKRWEGLMDGDPNTVNLDPYLDPVGIWTIGWGHAIRDLNGRYLRGLEAREKARALYPEGLTREQAESLLRADLLESAKNVSALVHVPLTDNQFAALCSFEFNCGALRKSTLLRNLNAGSIEAAADQFARWVYGVVGGERATLPGLVARRKDERHLFLTHDQAK